VNILVTGSDGQVGREIRELSRSYNFNFFFTNKKELDITKEDDIKEYVDINNINLIINCAAYTAVDNAEKDKDTANLVNHIGVKYLSDIAKERNILLIHISTDYVFDGKNYEPYIETDEPNPQGVYGLTKLRGEQAFKRVGAKGIIIRTSWVYSFYGQNFVKTMLRLKNRDELKVVFDQIGTPTYAQDLARTILEIVDKKLEKIEDYKAEIFHFSNEGVASWFDFAKKIFEIKNIKNRVVPIESKDYQTLAKRPYYSVLNKSKIKRVFNLEIPYWEDSLREYIRGLQDE